MRPWGRVRAAERACGRTCVRVCCVHTHRRVTPRATPTPTGTQRCPAPRERAQCVSLRRCACLSACACKQRACRTYRASSCNLSPLPRRVLTPSPPPAAPRTGAPATTRTLRRWAATKGSQRWSDGPVECCLLGGAVILLLISPPARGHTRDKGSREEKTRASSVFGSVPRTLTAINHDCCAVVNTVQGSAVGHAVNMRCEPPVNRC